MRAAPLLALAGLALVAPPAVAAPGSLSGKLTDGKTPSAATGRAFVRAIDVRTGRVAEAAQVGSGGAWKLAVDPGWYVLTASVVRADKPLVSAIAPVERVRSGRTTRTAVSLKRTKTPPAKKRKRRRSGARAAATQTAPVGVRAFTGTGPNPQLGRGLAEMLSSELTNTSSGDCEAQQVEVMRRSDILRELALANSGLVAPGSRIPAGNLIDPAYYIQGTVDTTATTTSWSLEIVDASTGKAVGGDSGTANGADIFDAPAEIAQRLLDQLCGGDYQVTIEINAQILIPPYTGFGLMTATVPVKPATGTPPTLRMGQANVVIGALSYGGVPGCDVVPGPHTGYAKVEIKPSSTPGQIEVTWGGETQQSTNLICPGAQITNGVPPIQPFQGTVPTVLILPAAGGTQSVGGGLGAWVNNGTVTVTRFPHGTL